ncbi:cell division site-positioning protein MapZ family protein [Streptococcus caballi]|uniref:cell division site-positioning protein MapZ family protein n=1 Tax=Streptococcus caballi TaxID=439220 RepID=UPI00036A2E08|nr:cell division site-positioning protein MapZ family protein [Streptococcus caballi]
MAEDKKDQIQENEDVLDFKDAKNMTVGEAVRKDSEIKAGVTEEDSVLDKYIKQHRSEVVSQKFESKKTDFDNLDTAALDDFIKKQRDELSKSGLIEDNFQVKNPTVEEKVEETKTVQTELVPSPESDSPAKPQFEEQEEQVESVQEKHSETERPVPDYLEDAQKNEKIPFYKRKGLILGVLFALLFVIFGSAYGLNRLNKNNNKAVASSSSSSKKVSKASSSSEQKQTKADKKAFDDKYATFFTDANKTKIKNSELSKLPELETLLKKLEKTTYYKSAKEKYDGLKRQIDAIQAVNSKFDSAAVVDGAKTSATVKSSANFDDLSSQTLNTGNANLDAVLQDVISDGRKQLSARSAATSSTDSNQTTVAPAQEAANQSETAPAQAATTNGTTIGSIAGASGYGLSNYDPAILQRDRSRVPYNDSAIADAGNAAWTFNSGVLEKIIATSQARGYITGNNFILERVNIINGNGYYNMFKPDGTYLFSINCKTGYFVGNASGNSDALDY